MLKIELKQHDNVLIGRVLEQDEHMRTTGVPISKILHQSADVSIVSANAPSLEGPTLFVRGADTARDDIYFCYAYQSGEVAETYYKLFLAAVDEVNGVNKSTPEFSLWEPERDESFHSITMEGDVILNHRIAPCYDRIVKANNVFQSETFAQKVAKVDKLCHLLWRLKEKYCPCNEFRLGCSNYGLNYDSEYDVWEMTNWRTRYYTTPYFDAEGAKKATAYLNQHPELWKDLV